MEILGCTLDPAGYKSIHGERADLLTSMKLEETYGFAAADLAAFNQIPEIILNTSISGPLLIDSVYRLNIGDSIIDAGQGVDDDVEKFAVSCATSAPATGWGPPTSVRAVTILGRMRVESIDGSATIWVHALEVFDNQKGCIKFSYFSDETTAGGAFDIKPRITAVLRELKRTCVSKASFSATRPTANWRAALISAFVSKGRTEMRWALSDSC